MAARKGPFYPMSNEHRGKIKNSSILNCLIEHVEGKRDLTATQVSAALGLLRKVLPDLAAAADTDDTGALKTLKSMSDAELEHIAAGRGTRNPKTQESPRVVN